MALKYLGLVAREYLGRRSPTVSALTEFMLNLQHLIESLVVSVCTRLLTQSIVRGMNAVLGSLTTVKQ